MSREEINPGSSSGIQRKKNDRREGCYPLKESHSVQTWHKLLISVSQC
jgi:hypothetical protein